MTETIERAEKLQSKLPPETLPIDGMSSPKVRHLLNGLCGLPGTVYLEIGVHQGSTFVSALFGNDEAVTAAYAIDNWSQFGQCKEAFQRNVDQYLSGYDGRLRFFEVDCFRLELSRFSEKVTTYFYDGHHGYAQQYRALEYYYPVLADPFVLLVDDWNQPATRDGTREAQRRLRLTVCAEWELPAAYNGDTERWWNGLYVAVMEKR